MKVTGSGSSGRHESPTDLNIDIPLQTLSTFNITQLVVSSTKVEDEKKILSYAQHDFFTK